MLPRVTRFSYALLGALAVHGALFLLHSQRPPYSAALAQQPLEVLVVEVPSAEDAPPRALAEEAQGSTAARTAVASPGAAARAVPHVQALGAGVELGAVAEPSDGLAAAPVAEGSAQADAAAPARKIDLHLDDGFFMRPMAPSEVGPRAHKPEVQRQLEASLSADDVKHGLARGNAFVGALHDAVREGGPTRGEALLSVTVGADGSLTGVEFLRGSASEWTAALEAFRSLAARKRLRVPPGARGLRVTYSVQAKVQLPSGKSLGAPGVDVQPSGLALQGTFDVADVGSNAQRLVYARVVSEEVL
jgi:hypothetical protein